MDSKASFIYVCIYVLISYCYSPGWEASRMQLLSTEHFPSRPNRNLPKNTTRGMPEQARNFDIWDSTVTILKYPLGQGIRPEKAMDRDAYIIIDCTILF